MPRICTVCAHARRADIDEALVAGERFRIIARRKLDLIVVWKLDRAFRSVAHMATTVEQLRRWGVGLRSYSEPMIDTSGTSPLSDLLLNLMASFAQFERALIAERVRAGMARAKKQGRRLGRPGGTHADGFEDRWTALRPQVVAGGISKKQAARTLGVSKSTVLRLLRADHDGHDMQVADLPAGRDGGAKTGVQNPVENALAERA